MKYSKYFPNHQEYASKVYRDILNKVLRIENQDHVDIPPKDNPEETHPEAITSASQSEGPILIQTYTQTNDKIRHELATQTDDEKVTDCQKPSTNPSSEQWECLKTFGVPRIVVSVIGAYNEHMPTYEWADDLVLKKALKHVARYAGIHVPPSRVCARADESQALADFDTSFDPALGFSNAFRAHLSESNGPVSQTVVEQFDHDFAWEIPQLNTEAKTRYKITSGLSMAVKAAISVKSNQDSINLKEEKYYRPENCVNFCVPRVNKEIWTALPRQAQTVECKNVALDLDNTWNLLLDSICLLGHGFLSLTQRKRSALGPYLNDKTNLQF
ncbi:unnamed protein product [Mytilus coruscus]|uniref:Uncharacterized protein n=1 Tax=Mytilus coruscus TaxID=42192 RepID=A0A6J8BRG8_MYTCO|nr:unnamed protein product [Mytilus coruscus]